MVHRYPFIQLDVLSDRPLTGNPLAVFLDGRGLTDSQMHGVAREMTQIDPTMGPVYPPTDVAAALGVEAEVLDPGVPSSSSPPASPTSSSRSAPSRRWRRSSSTFAGRRSGSGRREVGTSTW